MKCTKEMKRELFWYYYTLCGLMLCVVSGIAYGFMGEGVATFILFICLLIFLALNTAFQNRLEAMINKQKADEKNNPPCQTGSSSQLS